MEFNDMELDDEFFDKLLIGIKIEKNQKEIVEIRKVIEREEKNIVDAEEELTKIWVRKKQIEVFSILHSHSVYTVVNLYSSHMFIGGTATPIIKLSIVLYEILGKEIAENLKTLVE